MSPIHPDELGWTLDRVLERDASVVENLNDPNRFLFTGGTDVKPWIGNPGTGLGWGIGAAR